jgi:Asp-tRNA(Asn)/Glu-tRNA(Gln) amidotransferase A subunit family amidase
VACAQAPAGLPRSAPGRGDPASGSYLQAIERDPGRLTVGLSTGIWGRATRTDPEVAERVRAVAKLLDGLGHYIEEIANQSICDWQALWSAYCVNWVGGRAQFATTAKERGRAPERLQDYLGPMTYRHYLVAERYDKFDIWKMMERFDVRGTGALARPPLRCVPLHDAGERNRSARDLGAGRARWRRVADRRPALRQFLPRGRVATARRAGRTGHPE